MIKHDGTMGFIMPATILTSSTMQKVRDMLVTEYQEVVVITIAEAKTENASFSADTNMAECLVVAKKGVGQQQLDTREIRMSEPTPPECPRSDGDRELYYSHETTARDG